MVLSTSTIILEYVCPAMGTIMATIMFSAPYRDLQKAITQGHLGDLNPTPWAFMIGNCFGWVTYSILLQDLWIFFANCPGFILSIYLNLGAVKLLYQGHHAQEMRKSFAAYLQAQESKQSLGASSTSSAPEEIVTAIPTQSDSDTIVKEKGVDVKEKGVAGTGKKTIQDWAAVVWSVTSQTTRAPAPHENLILGIVVVWTACASMICFADSFSSQTRQLIVGCLVNLNLVVFYGAPLSTILAVLSTKTSNSIHVPTMVTNTLNGTFWTAYGIAVNDPLVYVPNGLGAFLGGLQFVLCFLFPRTSEELNGTLGDKNNPDTDGRPLPDL